MSFPQLFWILASCIILVLSSLHMVYTFVGNKFYPTDPDLTEKLKTSFIVITKANSIWRLWIGFHGSHSIGAMYFAAINLVLAIGYFDFLQYSLLIQMMTLVTASFYSFLGIAYWFSTPRNGIILATSLFGVAVILFHV